MTDAALYIFAMFVWAGIGFGIVLAFDEEPGPTSLVIILFWPLLAIGVPVALSEFQP